MAPGDHRDRTPIPGRRRPYDHLVLLAENNRGYSNLVKLVSTGYLEGFYHKPRVSKDLLAEHSEGLIALSACLSGEVSRLLLAREPKRALAAAEALREIFGEDNFFLEIQDHAVRAVSRPHPSNDPWRRALARPDRNITSRFPRLTE